MQRQLGVLKMASLLRQIAIPMGHCKAVVKTHILTTETLVAHHRGRCHWKHDKPQTGRYLCGL